MDRVVFDYRKAAYMLFCVFDSIEDFAEFDPADQIDIDQDLNESVSLDVKDLIQEDINKFSQIINHDFSQDSSTSLEIAELVQQLKIIMENLLKVLVTQKAYILYVDVWQRF